MKKRPLGQTLNHRKFFADKHLSYDWLRAARKKTGDERSNDALSL